MGAKMYMLRVNEAARELGVSESWLRRADKGGRIPKARRDINGWRLYT
jgi:DNA-binding transcriptional MerR regulator